jgi:hypothetical protein
MKKLKKFVTIVLATALLLGLCTAAWASSRSTNRHQQHRRSLAYNRNLAQNRNTLPLGWRYQAGYTLWRVNRNLPANHATYRWYRNDRAWHNRMHNYHRAEELLLNTIDWTVEEIAYLMHRHQELFKFHPAGIE